MDLLVSPMVKELSKFQKSHDEPYAACKQLYVHRGFFMPVSTLDFVLTLSHIYPLPGHGSPFGTTSPTERGRAVHPWKWDK